MLTNIDTPYRKHIEMPVELTMPIRHLEKTICQKESISASHFQHFHWDGNFLRDNETLEGDGLFMHQASHPGGVSLKAHNQVDKGIIQVFVLHPTGKTRVYDLEQSATIETFRRSISKRENESLDGRFYLVYGCKLLLDSHRTLADYFVYNESTVQMYYK